MISRAKINRRINQKTNSILVETIILAEKGNPELAAVLAVPSRQQARVNLDKLNKVKAEMAIIPGKVLSGGEITKKLKVCALGFSENAKQKLKKAGCEYKTIIEVLKSSKKGEKIKGEIIR